MTLGKMPERYFGNIEESVDMGNERAGRSGKKLLSAEALRELRKQRSESQTKFWKRFGVSQSRGSRFELGLELPSPVAILIRLYLEGAISDGDLWRARRGSPLKQAERESSPALNQA